MSTTIPTSPTLDDAEIAAAFRYSPGSNTFVFNATGTSTGITILNNDGSVAWEMKPGDGTTAPSESGEIPKGDDGVAYKFIAHGSSPLTLQANTPAAVPLANVAVADGFEFKEGSENRQISCQNTGAYLVSAEVAFIMPDGAPQSWQFKLPFIQAWIEATDPMNLDGTLTYGGVNKLFGGTFSPVYKTDDYVACYPSTGVYLPSTESIHINTIIKGKNGGDVTLFVSSSVPLSVASRSENVLTNIVIRELV